MKQKSIVLLLIWLLLCGTDTYAHNIQVARFDISHNGGDDFTIGIKFDRDDLLNSTFNTSNRSLSIKEQVFNYIESNFSLTFNGEKVTLNLDKITYGDEMIYVDGRLETTVTEVHKIEVTNTCLLKLEDHNNIIEFDMNDKLRSFRLTADRTSTEFDYY